MALLSWTHFLSCSLLLFLTPAPSLQVNIRLSVIAVEEPTSSNPPGAVPTMLLEVICNDIQPGKCCKAGPLRYSTGEVVQDPNLDLRVAAITELQPLDVAAVWKPSNGRRGCQGVPVDTRSGPGTWYYPDRNGFNANWAYHSARESENPIQDNNPYITGGSYMRIPTTMPKDYAPAPWLEAEGIIGLAWGNGQWFSNKVSSSLASSLLGGVAGASGSRLPLMKRGELMKRRITSSLKGTVFAQPPATSVWPDQIVINGTSYAETGNGSLKYVSATGETVTMSAGT